MSKSLAVFYCFPRSGGTLLNQCLLCSPANVVLSEVNPAWSVIEPEKQAADWFGLLEAADCTRLAAASYLEKIEAIRERAEAAGRSLCIRDWPGINFLPPVSTWPARPSLQLEQRLYLQKAGYQLKEIALLRRSQAVYESIQAHIMELQEMTVTGFATAYALYLEQITDVKKFYLETLIRQKTEAIRAISTALGLAYAEDFQDRFHLITSVTGNNTLLKRPASAQWTSIRANDTQPAMPPPLSREHRALFDHLDHLAGYETTA